MLRQLVPGSSLTRPWQRWRWASTAASRPRYTITPQQTSPELTALLQSYDMLEPRPTPLSTLFSFDNDKSLSSTAVAVLQSASYVRSEIARRLAKTIRSFDKLPYICGTNPFISRVHSLYKSSFHDLASIPEITSPRENEELVARLEAHVQMHSNDIPNLSKGLSECERYLTTQAIATFLDQVVSSRVGLRIIAEAHIAVSRATHQLPTFSSKPIHSTSLEVNDLALGMSDFAGTGTRSPLMPGGIVDTACSPERMVRMCAAFVSSMCDATFGSSPEVEIDGVVDAKFAYIPVHLEYILTELFKNSYRATIEKHQKNAHLTPASSTSQKACPPTPTPQSLIGSNGLPKILVTISPSKDYLSLRIRDQGGGIPPANLAHVFSYAFTTAKGDRYANLDDDSDVSSTGAWGEEDPGSGGGPYAAQQIGGAAALDSFDVSGSSFGGSSPGGGAGSAGLFGEITGKGVQVGMGTIAGFGYGLPLARLYATYFGGKLELMSLCGHGTDVYVKLRRLDRDSDIFV